MFRATIFLAVMIFFIFYLNLVSAEPLNRIELPNGSDILSNNTRRILMGNDVGDTRPYMVYLRPASTAKQQIDTNWFCGGAIIDEHYILTSAACIEEVKHFYVVSGTHRFIPHTDNKDQCIVNGAKKAIWKCVPKSYVFDGHAFDNIRWMVNDIAVVKVEDEFNFKKRVRGCDFIPRKIGYNNKSIELEKRGTMASTAGWGSNHLFSDVVQAPARMSSTNYMDTLQETDVKIISKKQCKKQWDERYHHIIDENMICGKDANMKLGASASCGTMDIDCKDLAYSDDEDGNGERRAIQIPVPSANQSLTRRMSGDHNFKTGGFCENDHGGPLVVGHGATAIVIGVISASQVRPLVNECYGPFLFTSVWNNRHLISCAVDKISGETCMKVLRSSRTQMFETNLSWKNHPEGEALNEERSAKAVADKSVRPNQSNATIRIHATTKRA